MMAEHKPSNLYIYVSVERNWSNKEMGNDDKNFSELRSRKDIPRSLFMPRESAFGMSQIRQTKAVKILSMPSDQVSFEVVQMGEKRGFQYC
ncbi:hypothetical protein AVEN_181364-1 [Araneus ventricosus]|uniref:Uncharacterized protein n=1 Tax=Araneus ventricosus TaxID=182803 RepID=A0A4Y2HRR6_ARAVE|nr:hypothetical protein AVEN_181364-1 [Araneus ventricosus]